MIKSLYARIGILEGDIEKSRLRIKELEDNMNELISGFLEYLKGNRYVLIRFSENLDLDLVARMRNSVLVMTIGELMNIGIENIISTGINLVVLIDVNDRNTLRPIWKRGGLRVIPLNMVYKGQLSTIAFIDGLIINRTTEVLSKELLNAVDEDHLRKIINEYRRLRSGALE
ncbi:hypothetical protein [Vulcanisaeta souniana]|uniref:hypothetical protein n=1 Tax=Vulcanisaeta souniana TaxID=164452 RepID=UPI0006D08682|nr:hypothetical protein [Vulcanisaeta souniana]